MHLEIECVNFFSLVVFYIYGKFYCSLELISQIDEFPGWADQAVNKFRTFEIGPGWS